MRETYKIAMHERIDNILTRISSTRPIFVHRVKDLPEERSILTVNLNIEIRTALAVLSVAKLVPTTEIRPVPNL